MAYVGGSAAAPVSYGEAESLWIQAGGDASVAPLMAAIAEAESSFVPNNWNTKDPSGGSFGLWQINGAHAQSLAAQGLTNWQTDPKQNALAAVQVYNSQGLGAWGGYTSGNYLSFLQNAVANGTTSAAAATSGLGSGSAIGTANSAPTSAAPTTFAPMALNAQTGTYIIVFAALVLMIGIWATTRAGDAPKSPSLAAALA